MYDHDMLTKRELLTKHRNDESSMCTVVYVIVHVCIRGIEEWAMYIIDSPLPVTYISLEAQFTRTVAKWINTTINYYLVVDCNVI